MHNSFITRSNKLLLLIIIQGFPGGSDGKESACNVGDLGSIPGLGRSPGEGKGYHSSILAWRIPPTPIFLPGESHGQRSLGGLHGFHRFHGVAKSGT